jgi:hypothetical protein
MVQEEMEEVELKKVLIVAVGKKDIYTVNLIWL